MVNTEKKTMSAYDRKVRFKRTLNKYVFIYAMMAVGILHFLTFSIYPNLNAFVLPFQNADGEWTWDNMKLVWNLITADNSIVWECLRNTIIYYFTGLILGFPFSVFFAYGLYRRVKLHRFYNFVFLIPMMISSVVLSNIFKNLISNTGPLAGLWEKIFHTQIPQFLYDPRYATWTMVFYIFMTGFGLNMIMYAGAMTRIPIDLWEQGDLDGLGYMRGLFSIALPLIWPTFSMMMVLSAIGVLGADGPLLLFTQGMYGTMTFGFWFYQNVVQLELYNYASAMGIYMSLASLPLFFLALWLRKKVPANIEY